MHVGKAYPFQYRNFIIPGNNYINAGPSRKMVLQQVGLAASGTVSALWLGTRTVSGLRQDSPRGFDWSLFTFENATDPTATIDISMRFELTPGWATSFPKLWWHVFVEPRSAGTLLCYREHFVVSNMWNVPVHGDTQVGPGWLGVVDPTLWFQNTFRFGASPWSDQPDYHPYRH